MPAYKTSITTLSDLKELISNLRGLIAGAPPAKTDQTVLAQSTKNLNFAVMLADGGELEDAFDQTIKALDNLYLAKGNTVAEYPVLASRQAAPTPATPPRVQPPTTPAEFRSNIAAQLQGGPSTLNAAAVAHERDLCHQLHIPFVEGRFTATEAEAKQKLEDASRARREQYPNAPRPNRFTNQYVPYRGMPFGGPMWAGNHPFLDYGDYRMYSQFGNWGGFDPVTGAFVPIYLAESLSMAMMPGCYDPMIFPGYVYGLDYGFGPGAFYGSPYGDPLFIMEVAAVEMALDGAFGEVWGDSDQYGGYADADDQGGFDPDQGNDQFAVDNDQNQNSPDQAGDYSEQQTTDDTTGNFGGSSGDWADPGNNDTTNYGGSSTDYGSSTTPDYGGGSDSTGSGSYDAPDYGGGSSDNGGGYDSGGGSDFSGGDW